jgi:hypothetical protein
VKRVVKWIRIRGAKEILVLIIRRHLKEAAFVTNVTAAMFLLRCSPL